MVRTKSRIGQKTGTSNSEKNVITNAMQKAFVIEYLERERDSKRLRQEKAFLYHFIRKG